MNPWTLVSTSPADGDVYLSNGYMSTSLSAAQLTAHSSAAVSCYIRGIYSDTGPGGIDRLARVPDWNRLRYGRPSSLRSYRRELDLRRGCVRTSMVLEEERGAVTLDHIVFASRADPHRAISRTEIRADFSGEIEFDTSLEACLEDTDVIGQGASQGVVWLDLRTRKYGIEVATALVTVEPEWSSLDTTGEYGISRRLTARVEAGAQASLTQIAQVATSLEFSVPREFILSSPAPFDELRGDHEAAWERLWATDIEIEGDPQTQQFVRSALYYLWSSVQDGDRWSIPPMGLSSNGYNGHIFWDAELWMYPSLLVTQPDFALSCLNYREHTVEAARARARSGGYHGARFPWEGGFTGEEMTPDWAEPRELQIHITADVALAHWWYFLATGDVSWLREHGFPIMKECAAFWLSRVEYDRERNRYEIRDVQCADEYAVGVNNDAFTNAAARLCLLATARAAELLGQPPDDAWLSVARGMYLAYDARTGRHVEYDGYDGQTTKQADVELLTYPLEYVTDAAQSARDLDYYRGVIDPNGPAMSYSVYSIIAAELGRSDDAYRYLQKSFFPNTRQPFWSFSETPINDQFYFCTGAGGALQALLFGFTGLRWREGHVVLRPILPDHWSALRLRNLFINGARTDIEMVPGRLALARRLEMGGVEAEIMREGESASLRVRVTDGAMVQPHVSIGPLDSTDWDEVRPGPDGTIALPNYCAGGFRFRVTAANDEVLHIVLLRLP